MKSERIDLMMVKRGLAPSRTKAQELIQAGFVFVLERGQAKQIVKPNHLMTEEDIEIRTNEILKYVSRGGLKLQQALEHLGLNCAGLQVLDVGQSTGGFTDCLLQKGAKKVWGIDVGEGQLDPKLKNHPQVLSFEKIHAVEIMKHSDFVASQPAAGFDLAVVDLSFISLEKVLPTLVQLAGTILCLVKPQFELGAQALNKSGIVKDEALYVEVEKKIKSTFAQLGWIVLDYFTSELRGKDGNQEFFVYAKRS